MRGVAPAFAVTQRGHGDASRPETGYRSNDFAADLAAFMDALQLQAAVIAGGSSGGFIARRFAIDHPDRTLGLVLLGSPFTLQDKPEVQEMWESTISRLTDPIDRGFVRGIAESTLAQPVPPAFLEAMVQENLKVPARVWRRRWKASWKTILSGSSKRSRSPPSSSGAIGIHCSPEAIRRRSPRRSRTRGSWSTKATRPD